MTASCCLLGVIPGTGYIANSTSHSQSDWTVHSKADDQNPTPLALLVP